MKRKILCSLATFTLTFVQSAAFAADGVSGYDEIMRELSLSEKASMEDVAVRKEDPIRIHGSVGFVAGRLNLAVPRELNQSQGLQGVEAVLGIDLFSKQWIAEGALRSFEADNYGSTTMALKEFDLRVVYETPLSRRVGGRFGGGMSARYLRIPGGISQYGISGDYSTPASVILAGLKLDVNSVVAISADASLRSRLVTDTIDRGSFDAGVKVTGTF